MIAIACECDEELRSACSGLDAVGVHEGKRYCVLHLPDKGKRNEFWRTVEAKLERQDFDFGGAWFPDVADFAEHIFEAHLNLRQTSFSDDLDFSKATFCKGVDLSEARFAGDTSFAGATFGATGSKRKLTTYWCAIFRKNADFSGATFNTSTTFEGARFKKEAEFSDTTYNAFATFAHARFYNFLEFGGSNFNEIASFNGAIFRGQATISGGPGSITTFKDYSNFASTRFRVAAFIGAVFEDRVAFTERAVFGEGNFNSACFKKEADFRKAIFKRAGAFRETEFELKADFTEATFHQANFQSSRFDGKSATFTRTVFGPVASFMDAKFETQAMFARAVFSGEARFTRARFVSRVSFALSKFDADVLFDQAVFDSDATVLFLGEPDRTMFNPQSLVRLDYAHLSKPAHVSFNSVNLRPSFFLNVSARDISFSNVRWQGMPEGPAGSVEDEVRSASDRVLSENEIPHLLSQTFRELAINAEENRRFSEASHFSYQAWSLDLRQRRFSRFRPWDLLWWYWALSGFGDRPGQAFGCLVGLLIVFAAMYLMIGLVPVQEVPCSAPAPYLNPPQGNCYDGISALPRAVAYSLGVLALRRPEPRPAAEEWWPQLIVTLETIFIAVQVALFVLALRRRFMR